MLKNGRPDQPGVASIVEEDVLPAIQDAESLCEPSVFDTRVQKTNSGGVARSTWIKPTPYLASDRVADSTRRRATEKQNLTVLSVDIRGFTSLAERMDPEECVHVLNGYFDVAVDVVLEFDGEVDKFQGDGFMAIFSGAGRGEGHEHRAVRCALELRDSNANGKIFTICSAKRGSGATTIAINLAAALAENPSARVALIDLDWPLGDAAAFLNIKPRFTVADAIASVARMDSVLLESYMQKHDRFQVLAGLENFVDGDPFDAAAVSQLLEVVTQTYTHAVVDLPPSVPSPLFQTVIDMSSSILAIVTPDLLSLRRTERLLKVFNSKGVADRVRLVLNRSTKSSEITDGDIEKALRQPVASKVANDYYACQEAINSGKALVATSNKNAARHYRDLAGQLTGQNQKKKGLLGLLPRTSASFS